MEKGQVLKDLPTDVLMNIQSYFLGEPDSLKKKQHTQENTKETSIKDTWETIHPATFKRTS